jgi:uncharacterized protein YtpQ (UPF0354 family)
MKTNFRAAIILLLALIGCNNKHVLSLSEFRNLYADSIQQICSDCQTQLQDDSTIVFITKQDSILISTENIYKTYLNSPDSASKIISHYVSVLRSMAKEEPIKSNSIYPIIKPSEYFQFHHSNTDSIIRYKLCGELELAFVIDSKNSFTYITDSMIIKNHISSDSILPIALKNLSTKTDSLYIYNLGDSIYFLTIGGDYDLSLALLDNLWTKDNIPVNGDFIVAMPNRDLLLVTGSKNSKMNRFKEIIKKSYTDGDYPVTMDIFQYKNRTLTNYQ